MNENTIVRPGQNGADAALQRVGFGTTETMQHQRETQGTALAARAQAEVQARYIVAIQRPRHIEQFRVRLLEHCQRPGFAQVATYSKPVGGKRIEGPSIRFVESALQEFGNVLPEETITFDDDLKRVTRVSVTDLERNITYYGDVIVEKTVERRSPKDGDEVLGSRLNSYKEPVYKIRATEDDLANKVGAACSKKLRNLGLRILPADIVAEAQAICAATMRDRDAKDPAAARRQLADAFAALRIMPADLEAYLGHAFDQCAPAELDDLRGAFVAVRDGEVKWSELVESARAQRGEIDKSSKAADAASEKVKARIAKVKAAGTAGAKKDAKPADAKSDAKTADGKPDAKAADPKDDMKTNVVPAKADAVIVRVHDHDDDSDDVGTSE